MTDDELRRALETALPTVDDNDVETALLRTHAAVQTRQRRRRLAVRLAPVLAAAATVAVVMLATLSNGGGRHTPTTSPSPTPSAGSVNTWFRHATGQTTGGGVAKPSSVWVVRLSDANHGTFDVRPNAQFGRGALVYDGSRGGWVVSVLDKDCNGRDGVYRVVHDGPSLTFTVVTDPCELRRDLLDNAVFAPLTNPDQLVG